MIGDDACSTFVELLKRILDIVSDIEKEKRRGEGYQKKDTPKIKVGKLSKSNFAKLQKAGADFKFVTVPANKLAEIEETVKKMGGSYFNAEVGDNNNAVLAVPASQLDLLNMAMKHVVANELAENSENIIVKDGKDLIDAEDIGIISRVMNKQCKYRYRQHRLFRNYGKEGIMFSATYGGYRNTITVSKADAQRANAIAAEYKVPAQNKQNYQQRIIGNIEYSQIRDRNFINTDPATALQVANLLSGDTSIRFSGRILANSATITVSGRKNAEMVNRMIENIRNADIINELYRAGYERMADTNGFVNIRNNSTGEIVGFRSMDMVREMFHDQSNEFFHPSAYRVDMTAETAQPYYISEVEKSSAEERNVYVDENGGVPTFESQPEAEEYASNNGIDLSDFEEIISERQTLA